MGRRVGPLAERPGVRFGPRHVRLGRCRRRRQGRTEGLFDGRLFERKDRRGCWRAVPGQLRLLATRGLLALGPAQGFELARFGAGTALVHMPMALALFVLAVSRAVAIHNSPCTPNSR